MLWKKKWQVAEKKWYCPTLLSASLPTVNPDNIHALLLWTSALLQDGCPSKQDSNACCFWHAGKLLHWHSCSPIHLRAADSCVSSIFYWPLPPPKIPKQFNFCFTKSTERESGPREIFSQDDSRQSPQLNSPMAQPFSAPFACKHRWNKRTQLSERMGRHSWPLPVGCLGPVLGRAEVTLSVTACKGTVNSWNEQS